jgi:hypothetical protein
VSYLPYTKPPVHKLFNDVYAFFHQSNLEITKTFKIKEAKSLHFYVVSPWGLMKPKG